MTQPRIRVALAIAVLLAGAVQSTGQTIPPASQADELMAVLQSDAPYKEKSDACRQLGVIATKDAVAPLAALLGDEELSHMARYALEPIPDPSVDAALRDALGKLEGRLLVGVIGSIGARRDAEAVKPLAEMLRDPDADVAQAAARSLGKIGNSDAANALQAAVADASAANQLAFCEGLFRCAETLAEEGRRDQAVAVFDQLCGLDAAHQVRGGAVRGAILARQRDDGVALLEQHLRSDDYILFSAAVQTAQELPGADVTEALTAGLNQLPADNQVLAIQALGKRGDVSASSTLSALAGGGAPAVRVAAIRALAELGDGSASSVFVDMLEDADAEVSQAAQDALAALEGSKADAAVMALLDSRAASRRLIALELIGRRRMTASIPALLAVAADADGKVRQAALGRVGELGGRAELQPLLDLLMDLTAAPDLDAAERALTAVCAKAADAGSCTEKVAGLLAQADPAQEGALLAVLGSIGGPSALKAVRAAVEDPNDEVHAAAVRALVGWGTVDVTPDLLALAETSRTPSLKIAALRGYISLARQEGLSTETKLAMARKAAALAQRNEERQLLLGVLGEVPAAEALSMVMGHVADAAIMEEACMAAVAVSEKIFEQNPGEVADALQEVMRATQNEDVTRRAQTILDKLKGAQ